MSEKQETQYRSALARARFLGSANEGSRNWWAQRVSAVALAFLSVWLMTYVMGVDLGSYEAVTAWLSGPFTAVGVSVFLFVTFYHAWLGAREIIEDYVHNKPAKIASLLAVQFACFGFGAVGVFSVLKIAFGG